MWIQAKQAGHIDDLIKNAREASDKAQHDLDKTDPRDKDMIKLRTQLVLLRTEIVKNLMDEKCTRGMIKLTQEIHNMKPAFHVLFSFRI